MTHSFTYDADTTLRLAIIDGAPWFYGHDFYARLGYESVETMRSLLWPDQFRLLERDEDLHIDRDETLVSVSGLFRCINEAPGYYAVGGLDAPWEDVHYKFRVWIEREVMPEAWKSARRSPQNDPRIEYLRQFSPLSWDMNTYYNRDRPTDEVEAAYWDARLAHCMPIDAKGNHINPIIEAQKICREVKSIWGAEKAQALWDYLEMPSVDAWTRSKHRL